MDINLLALNVGNSRLALGVFAAGELIYTARIAHDQRSDWPGRIADAWSKISETPDAAVAGASVNPALLEAVEHAVEQQTGKSIQWVGSDLDIPIPVKTDAPDQTGIDRILNVAAAYEQMAKACVVVDAGTAVTINCCNDRGEFVGGTISPGAAMQLNALHEHTARLPLVTLEAPREQIGRSTRSAIQQGVFHGIRGLVKEVVENFATDLGTWPDIIATGGDAAVLFEGWELIHAIAPDLTLYGVALAYASHHIKHGT
jgi:type III pantothenate kinase